MTDDRTTGGRFARVPAAAVFDSRLSAEAKVVLAALAVYADKDGLCWPAVSTLANRLGRTRRAVQLQLRTLEAAGYVLTVRRLRNRRGGYGTNGYQLVFAPLPDLPSAPAAEATVDGRTTPSGDSPQRTTGHAIANARDVKPDFASDATEGVTDTSDAKPDCTTDAKFGRTSDAKPGFALTDHIELAQATAHGCGFDRSLQAWLQKFETDRLPEARAEANARLWADIASAGLADTAITHMTATDNDAAVIAECQQAGSGLAVIRDRLGTAAATAA